MLTGKGISSPRLRALVVVSHPLGDGSMLNLPRCPVRLVVPIRGKDLDALFDVFSRILVVGKQAFLRRQDECSDLVRILQSVLAIRHRANRDGSR
jgi:hypothetical protein